MNEESVTRWTILWSILFFSNSTRSSSTTVKKIRSSQTDYFESNSSTAPKLHHETVRPKCGPGKIQSKFSAVSDMPRLDAKSASIEQSYRVRLLLLSSDFLPLMPCSLDISSVFLSIVKRKKVCPQRSVPLCRTLLTTWKAANWPTFKQCLLETIERRFNASHRRCHFKRNRLGITSILTTCVTVHFSCEFLLTYRNFFYVVTGFGRSSGQSGRFDCRSKIKGTHGSEKMAIAR